MLFILFHFVSSSGQITFQVFGKSCFRPTFPFVTLSSSHTSKINLSSGIRFMCRQSLTVDQAQLTRAAVFAVPPRASMMSDEVIFRTFIFPPFVRVLTSYTNLRIFAIANSANDKGDIMNMQQMAKYLADKSQKQTIAAFLIDGRIRSMSLEGERFERMLKDYPRRCLGVYYCVPEAWVLEDIQSLSN